jgi:DNA polymerase-3 subunit beta
VNFTCTDLDITLFAHADCEVIEPGETTIPIKTFSAAVNKVVAGDIELSVNHNEEAKLKAGTTVFKFNCIPAKEFPLLPAADGSTCTVEAQVIREMLRKTAFAMSADETRAALSCVLLDFEQDGSVAKAVATDGRRLSTLVVDVEKNTGFNGKFALARKAVDLLAKKMPKDGVCTIVSCGSQLCFKTNKLEVTVKLRDLVYPNYSQVIPKSFNQKLTVNRVELLGAIDRISVVTAGVENPCVGMVFADNKIALSAITNDNGAATDEIAIKYLGESIDMKFNPQYLRDVLSALDEEEVDFFLTASTAPAQIKKHDAEDYIYVVMPLRTN